MTSGTIISGSDPRYPNFSGTGTYKNWMGGDGRTELIDGAVRTKWNSFYSHKQSRSRNPASYSVLYKEFPDDPLEEIKQGDLYVDVAWDGFGRQLDFTDNDELRLQSQLLNQVKSHDFNLGVNLGEMSKTVDMVSTTLRKLGRSVLALKRGDFRTAARQLGARPRASKLGSKDVSGRWLELQYGWLPLISESYEGAKAFEAISKGPRKKVFRTSIKAKGTFEGSQSPSLNSALYREELNRYLQYEMYEEMTVERQLGLLDPLSVAWELLPYSFVVDWFIPIGTYLSNLNQVPSLKGRFLKTDVRKRFGYHEMNLTTGWNNGWFVIAVLSRPRDVNRETYVNRVASSALSPPLPSFNTGGLSHGKRFWNALALAYQRFA